jgi:NADPH:quinone reductase-like Zn-dependent oxidoreductase
VVAAGPGLLPRLMLGRRVACASTPALDGSWAEYMVTSAGRCIPLQKQLSLEQGAMLIVNPLTALAFFEIARRGGHRAMVNNAAASALGQMVLRLGRQRGMPIIHVVRRPEQVELLQQRGAEYVLNSRAEGFVEELQRLAHQLKATLALDAVAGKQTAILLEALPFGSTVVVYAHLSGEAVTVDSRALFYDDKRVEGFYLGNWMAGRGLLRALNDARRAQRLLGEELATHVQQRLPLTAAAEGVTRYVGNMTAGKILLVADPAARPTG